MPSEVRTLRSADRVLWGMENLMRLSVQAEKEEEVSLAEPMVTELVPRVEPKLVPSTVTRISVLLLCMVILSIRGETTS